MSVVVNPLSRKGEEKIVFFCGNNLRPPSSLSLHLFIRNSGKNSHRNKLISRLAWGPSLATEKLKHHYWH